MANKNKEIVQNFRHLVHYPNLTIEQTVYKTIAELKLHKKVAINHFLSRLNFYLYITEKTLSLKRKQQKALNIISNIENNITNRKENIIAVKKWGELLERWNANQQPSQSNS